MSRRIRLYLVALAVWLGMFALAFANGALRVMVLEPWLGDVAQPVSGILGIIFIGTVAALFARHARPSLADAFVIGTGWFVLTLGIEMVLMLFAGRPASEVADAFTFAAIAKGDLFAPMLVWMAAVPAAMVLTRTKSDG